MITEQNVGQIHRHLLDSGIADASAVFSDGRILAGALEITDRADVQAALASYVEPEPAAPAPTLEERLEAAEAALLDLLLGG